MEKESQSGEEESSRDNFYQSSLESSAGGLAYARACTCTRSLREPTTRWISMADGWAGKSMKILPAASSFYRHLRWFFPLLNTVGY